MSKKAACKCKSEACEECPEWIFTFADLVMLMMGFFVILWVLKPNPTKDSGKGSDNSQWVSTAGAIREAFGYVPNPTSTDPVDMALIAKQNMLMIPSGPGQGGQTNIRKQGATGTDDEVTTIRLGKQMVVGGRIPFSPGDGRINPAALKGLDEVALQIRGHRNIVMIKGHTSLDDLPDTATPQQKMELSLRRAQAVADHLVEQGVSPDILRVQGCSTFEPVVQRDYGTDAQSTNRRVEVEVTSTLVSQMQAQQPTTPTTKSANTNE